MDGTRGEEDTEDSRTVTAMNSRFFLLPALLVLMVVVSCSRYGQCQYISKSDLNVADGNEFRFEAELSEGDVYETGIAMRYDATAFQAESVEMDICLISPRGEKYIERAEFPLSEVGGGLVRTYPVTVGGLREIEWIYRTNIKVDGPSAGVWKVGIKPVRKNLLSAIQGIGFYCRNGKR